MFDKKLHKMENYNTTTEQEINWSKIEKSHRRGKIIGGIFVVTAGVLYLLKELGSTIPDWIFTWQMFLIALGVFIGFKHSFRRPSWFILIAIGSLFLVSKLYPTLIISAMLWPIAIIAIGLFMIFKPRRKYGHFYKKFYEKKMRNRAFNGGYSCYDDFTSSSEDKIETTTFMGGVKKNIISKNFKGGEVTNVFGGTELNLSQADFEGAITLEMTNVFGGTKLILPANWEINSELVSVMGNVEDKRPIPPTTNVDMRKVLNLRGTTFMGGIEIKSY